MVDGRLLSYKESNFSGAMLNFGRVSEIQKIIDITGYGFAWILTWWFNDRRMWMSDRTIILMLTWSTKWILIETQHFRLEPHDWFEILSELPGVRMQVCEPIFWIFLALVTWLLLGQSLNPGRFVFCTAKQKYGIITHKTLQIAISTLWSQIPDEPKGKPHIRSQYD